MKLFSILIVNLLLLTGMCFSAPLIIDDFDYTDTAAAQAAWNPMSTVPEVEMADSGDWGTERVMKLPCNFSLQSSRCYWDKPVSLDLSAYRKISLEIFIPDQSDFGTFTLYFQSGSGWYANSKYIGENGWQTLDFSIPEYITEGTPSGWDQITGIRLSPWKAGDNDTYFAVRKLEAYVPLVYMVQSTKPADADSVEQLIQYPYGFLSKYDISMDLITDTDLENNVIAGSRMVILPINNNMTDTELTVIENYVAGGGKIMVCYYIDNRLADLLGVSKTSWTQGDFGKFIFTDTTIQDLPASVNQDSWNIMITSATGAYNSRVIANWHDDNGAPTGYPAWIANDNGLYMSHVILNDDPDKKEQMLLAMIGHYIPEIWPAIAEDAIENIHKIATYTTYTEAVNDIRTKGLLTPRFTEVENNLTSTDNKRNQAIAHQAASEYIDCLAAAREARNFLLEAYYLCQQTVDPEFRAVWEHSGSGIYPGNWEASIQTLVDNGFNAVFPNMLWGGEAHYNSSVLPHSNTYDTYGDQIAACVAAAHAHNVEVHVWKVNWNFTNHAPQSFIDSMRAANRTQVSATGEDMDWLCPSHPDNLALELAAMMEVVNNYDVDGIHFDYIRYPNSNHCYCDGCRTRFQAQSGHIITSWPADVLSGGPYESDYLDWKRQNITNLVQAVHDAVQLSKPDVKVSAAVFSNYSTCYDGVSQDWVDWIDKGLLDFICPMDYTTDHAGFENKVVQQLGYAAGRLPVYPGIGASTSYGEFGPDDIIVQILMTREYNTGGFIVFNYDSTLGNDYLPKFSKGLTIQSGGSHVPNWDKY